MMKYCKQYSWKHFMRSPMVLLIVLVAFIFLSRSVWGMYKKAQISDERLAQARQALSDLNQHKEDLASKVAYLSTDQGIESEIRTKFRAAADGESIAVIVGDTQVAAVSEASTTVKVSWWRRLFQSLGL